MKKNRYMTDEEILCEAYKRLALIQRAKTKEVAAASDAAIATSMIGRSSLAVTQLSSHQSITDIKKIILNAKIMYAQYLVIKDRSPQLVNKSLERNMGSLVSEVCRCEADMIKDLRLQETDGIGIDVSQIFLEKKYLRRLGALLARDIVRSAIHGNDASKYVRDLFVTRSGSKYHVSDCPFCKNTALIPASRDIIEDKKLMPCKCLGMAESAGDRGCVTAFIDESIHSVEWDEDGKVGTIGNFSYIVCRGSLFNESQINDENIITYGVDYSSEHGHTDRITKAAIEKVLIMLAYDYDFVGCVKIYTDSQSIVGSWNKARKARKLARLFAEVSVEYVSRKENREADSLCRESIVLNIPTKTYYEVVNKCARVEKLEARVKELEALVADQGEFKDGWRDYISRLFGSGFFKKEIPVKNI